MDATIIAEKIDRLKNEFGYGEFSPDQHLPDCYEVKVDRGAKNGLDECLMVYKGWHNSQRVIRKVNQVFVSPDRRIKFLRSHVPFRDFDTFLNYVVDTELEFIQTLHEHKKWETDMKDYWLEGGKFSDSEAKKTLSLINRIERIKAVCSNCGNSELIKIQFRDTGEIQTCCPACMHVGVPNKDCTNHVCRPVVVEEKSKPKRWNNIEF